MGPVSATVITGDCLDVLRTLAPGSVDAIVTDPPYGMRWNTDSTRFSGGVAPNARTEYQKRGIPQGKADWGTVAGDDVVFDPAPWLAFPKVVIWGANHFAARLPVGTTLVWLKKHDYHFGTFLSDAEIGWQKGGYGVYCHRALFPPPSRMAENDGKHPAHPTQKPVELMRWCIRRLNLAPGSLVLDPYCGSGSTGVAAVMEGMTFLGIEREPAYADVARRRIAEAQAQTTLFESNG
jgi:site-specific DNA-methyltransferase (adenine-specific)